MSQLKRSPGTIWHYLTIVLGAVPALILCAPAGIAMWFGVILVIGGVVSLDLALVPFGLLIFMWGGSGIYGVTALWSVGLGYDSEWVESGLLVGTLAILPVTSTVLVQRLAPGVLGPDWIWALVVTLPPIIAIGWLIVFALRPRPENDPSGGPTRFVGRQST